MGFFSDLVSTVKDIIPVAATVAGGIFGGPGGAAAAAGLIGQIGFRGTTGQGIAAAPIEQIVGPLPTITSVQPPPSFGRPRRGFKPLAQRRAPSLSAVLQAEGVSQMGFADIFGGIASALGFGAQPTTAPAQPLAVFQQRRAVAVASASTRVDPRIIMERQAQGRGGGNGFFATDTIVQTIDLRTGNVVRQKILSGSPFLMNNEVNKLRTVARKLGKANARLPRKTVRPSVQKELISAVTQNALRRILTDGSCPS